MAVYRECGYDRLEPPLCSPEVILSGSHLKGVLFAVLLVKQAL
jgi:hypothetical protein